MSTKKSLAAIALALPLALLLGACAGGSSDTAASGDASGSSETVRIGVVGAGDPYWETYKEAAAAEGIDVEIVNFDSYDQPNPALSAGELDLNQFQHIIYLATYNVAASDDLVPIGATAPQAAGVIHGDFERGFIRAQTIAFDDFIALKGEQGAKDAGKMRAEGKEYIVKDGDVLNFLFNV